METSTELYELLYRVVKGWPAVSGSRCQQLQTFAVIQGDDDVNSPTLEKSTRYIGKELFFSRDWESANYRPSSIGFSYPALFIVSDNKDWDWANGCFTKVVSFRLFILDEAPRKEDTTKGRDQCHQRTVEEVEAAVDSLLESLLEVVFTSRKIKAQTPGGKVLEGWFPVAALEAAKDSGQLLFPWEELEVLELGELLTNNTISGVSIRDPFNMDDVMGTFVTISLKFDRKSQPLPTINLFPKTPKTLAE